jgi:class 3 adenylate cyclase
MGSRQHTVERGRFELMTVPFRPYPEERRLATVLFADIQGFTALSDHLDIEEVRDSRRPLHSRGIN